MTLTPSDLGLAPAAAARFDEYLRQVRAALAGTPDVSADEVEADIREHVARALQPAPRPVPVAALGAVLDALGPPSQWGAGTSPTLLARAGQLLREVRAALGGRAARARAVVWNGPEDWRLAYLSFGVLAVGALTMVLFPVALLVSYVLSRAGLAVARERGVALDGGRKWLLYPPVVLVSLSALIAATAWPLALGGVTFEQVEQVRTRAAWAHGLGGLDAPPLRHAHLDPENAVWASKPKLEPDRRLLAAIPVPPDLAPVTAGLFVGAGAAALWWLVLGLLGARFPNAVRAAFHPLCDHFEDRHGRQIALAAFLVLVMWIATTVRFVDRLL